MLVSNPELRKLIEEWNGFVEAIQKAEKHFDVFTKMAWEMPDTAGIGYENQKALSNISPRYRFKVFLPRFLDTCRHWGGAEYMLVKGVEFPEEKLSPIKKKENKDD